MKHFPSRSCNLQLPSAVIVILPGGDCNRSSSLYLGPSCGNCSLPSSCCDYQQLTRHLPEARNSQACQIDGAEWGSARSRFVFFHSTVQVPFLGSHLRILISLDTGTDIGTTGTCVKIITCIRRPESSCILSSWWPDGVIQCSLHFKTTHSIRSV